MSTIGNGPYPKPWPEDGRYDPELLTHGDSRNVIDKYRYWKVEAIKADLDKSRFDIHIAIENWQHDFNIGTIVRNANAFNVAAVHIIGKKHWNRRGAMVTDAYMHIFHHATVDDFRKAVQGRVIVGVDNIENAQPIDNFTYPEKPVLVFGGEGPGLSKEMMSICQEIIMIPQYGSTRSVNVGVASGIILHNAVRQII
jgi:tRNA G18 (ribose-2'-O)-methylase SpoU